MQREGRGAQKRGIIPLSLPECPRALRKIPISSGLTHFEGLPQDFKHPAAPSVLLDDLHKLTNERGSEGNVCTVSTVSEVKQCYVLELLTTLVPVPRVAVLTVETVPAGDQFRMPSLV